jgi:hypothetical protein
MKFNKKNANMQTDIKFFYFVENSYEHESTSTCRYIRQNGATQIKREAACMHCHFYKHTVGALTRRLFA